ncbi:hypothetical protein QTH97_30720 [Variovorax sp. J22R24]|uniref:hypothetical protein n=1 Tax=Variovorax gracilis TaxID=3053502 RepID=UPI002577C4C6|nr:hypothetical protein [Variovorax sp. J22R24]MDM0109338.1 hypothetical protein [Variovorax sp. J22R24]
MITDADAGKAHAARAKESAATHTKAGQPPGPRTLRIAPIQQLPGFGELRLVATDAGALTLALSGSAVFLRSAEQRLLRGGVPAMWGDEAVSLKALWSQMLSGNQMKLRCRVQPL